MLKAQRREIIKRWNPWHHLSCAPPVLRIGVFQPSVFLPGSSTRWGRPEGGDHRGKCTSRSFQKGPSVWFLLPVTAYEMQIWATQGQEIHFTMLMVSSVLLKSYCDHGLEQLDTTTGEAFWKAISLAHNIGLTLPEKSMVKLRVILTREEVGQYWKISCTAFIFCHWFLVIPRERGIILNLHEQSREVLLPGLGFCSTCRNVLYSIKLSCDTC